MISYGVLSSGIETKLIQGRQIDIESHNNEKFLCQKN